MATTNRQLFISFSGLITRIELGDLAIEEIRDDALFYFGCVKSLALYAENYPAEYVEKSGAKASKAKRREIYSRLQPILIRADAEGRLEARRDKYAQNSYKDLSALLVANNITPMPEAQDYNDHLYSYSAVERLVVKAALPLEVIY